MVPLETGHAITDAMDNVEVVAAEEDVVVIGLLTGEELEASVNNSVEDVPEVDDEEAAANSEAVARELDEVLAVGGVDKVNDDWDVPGVDVRELARALPILLKVRVSTVTACAAEVTAVLGAEARTVVPIKGTTEEAKEVVLKIELGRELLGQLCMLRVTVCGVPVTVEVVRLVMVVVL